MKKTSEELIVAFMIAFLIVLIISILTLTYSMFKEPVHENIIIELKEPYYLCQDHQGADHIDGAHFIKKIKWRKMPN